MRAFRLLTMLLAAAAAVGLGNLLTALPDPGNGLRASLAGSMPSSGVTHPVTAVLLNFRAYDTFLEMLVLLLAVLGVGVSRPAPASAPLTPPSPLLEQLLRLLVPPLVVVAAYLLWIGASAPGGAFQAGAVLGAAGVLTLLTEQHPRAALPASLIRMLLGAGVAAFTVTGLVLSLLGAGLLTFPVAHAGSLILLIEALATLAIAGTLVALFAGLAAAED